MQNTDQLISKNWQYLIESYQKYKIDDIQLLLWNKGMCVVQVAAQQVISVHVYLGEKNWEVTFFEQLLLNEALGEHGNKISKIWIAEERNLLIPKKLYEGEASKLWLKKLYHIESNEDILTNEITSINTEIVFAFDAKVSSLIKQYFKGITPSSFSKIALSNVPNTKNGSMAHLILLNKTALLSVSNDGKLLVHQIFEFETIEDIVYKIAIIAEKNDFNAVDVTFNVSGLNENIEEVGLDLRSYFNSVIVDVSDKGPIINFINQFIACE